MTADPRQSPNAVWFHDTMASIAAARRQGDTTTVNRLLAYVSAEGGPQLRRLADQALAAVDKAEQAAATGGVMEPHPIGLAAPGELLCDFCTNPNPTSYFPFTEFSIEGPAGEWRSGNRMYACDDCLPLVEAGDWKGLRTRVGATATNPAVRVLWSGFARNRTGPPVPTTGAPRE